MSRSVALGGEDVNTYFIHISAFHHSRDFIFHDCLVVFCPLMLSGHHDIWLKVGIKQKKMEEFVLISTVELLIPS